MRRAQPLRTFGGSLTVWMLALVLVLALVPLIVAGRMRRVERRTLARLRDAGATLAERAILLERGGPVADLVHERLERAHVLRTAGNDRYYLDVAAYDAFTGRRRRRALMVLAGILGVLGAMYFGGLWS